MSDQIGNINGYSLPVDEDQQAMINWSKNKNAKIQGLANGTWGMLDDLGSVGPDTKYMIGARAASHNISEDNPNAPSDAYQQHVDAYNLAKEAAMKQGSRASLDPSEAQALSAWAKLVNPNKP